MSKLIITNKKYPLVFEMMLAVDDEYEPFAYRLNKKIPIQYIIDIEEYTCDEISPPDLKELEKYCGLLTESERKMLGGDYDPLKFNDMEAVMEHVVKNNKKITYEMLDQLEEFLFSYYGCGWKYELEQ